MKNIAAIHSSESKFHDRWAHQTPLAKIAVREAFEAPTALENRAILALMGDLRGQRLLDIGAGLGESSVYFALAGAHVTTVDLSPGMVECAMALARAHGVSIAGVVQSGERLDVPEEYFDIVYVANTIHHVTAKDLLFRQIHRALKPGGRFFSYDPLCYNPLIALYRRLAVKVRTVDEAPLSFEDVALARRYFPNVQHREFWILTLSLFLKYFLIDRVHPNRERYWKKILLETPRTLWWWAPLALADRYLTRLPLIRCLAWNMVMWGDKPAPPPTVRESHRPATRGSRPG